MKINNKELQSIYFDKHPNKWYKRKSPILWGEFEGEEAPLLYIKKPKWINDDDFQKILDNIILKIK